VVEAVDEPLLLQSFPGYNRSPEHSHARPHPDGFEQRSPGAEGGVIQ
jgi:hypothetical protein